MKRAIGIWQSYGFIQGAQVSLDFDFCLVPNNAVTQETLNVLIVLVNELHVKALFGILLAEISVVT